MWHVLYATTKWHKMNAQNESVINKEWCASNELYKQYILYNTVIISTLKWHFTHMVLYKTFTLQA